MPIQRILPTLNFDRSQTEYHFSHNRQLVILKTHCCGLTFWQTKNTDLSWLLGIKAYFWHLIICNSKALYLQMIKQLYRFLSPKFQNLFLDYKVDLKPRWGHGKPPHKGLYDVINANRSEYETLLHKALEYKESFKSIQDATQNQDPTMPAWNNGYLPGLDIIGIYTLLSHFKPKKYIEIGSGNSTKVAYKAKKEQELSTSIISIDPMPRAEIDHLADQIIRSPFENLDLAMLLELEENDILFVDNSHRILPNSDAMVFFMEILPQLKKGVIVHIHDIFLPYDYPQEMCDRFYSEQYGLGIFLIADPVRYQTIFPNYFISEDKALASILDPIWQLDNTKNVERHGGSFWLRIGN